MKKIRICHVIDGSSQNPLLFNSIKYSDSRRFEHQVVTLEAEGALHSQLKGIGVDATSLNHTGRKDYPKSVLRLINYFRKERFDIVQTHLFDSSLIGITSAWLARVPVRIFSGHHSHEIPLYGRRLLTLLDSVPARWLSHRSIAPSEDMKAIFERFHGIPSNKIEVLNHGFDLESWRTSVDLNQNLKKELGLEHKILFGTVGRLFWVKNLEALIRGFTRVSEKRSDLALAIVGEGGDRKRLEALTRELGSEDRIRFLGHRSDIASVIRSFDCYVHSALAESFGMVFIEAMALGKPIISTPVGIAKELLADGSLGELSAGYSEDEIMAALLKMLERSNEWAEIGKLAVDSSEDFSIRVTQTACDEFYLQAVGGS